ncbi:hypothetical protein NP493_405g03022 [Ridgeia piscesae]|uniref:RRM domain-containing protein n=1 Tax=Ridgeia piscesae TaxID=27915 RepID=A0AAD9L1G4_RIDPI|nr:hypothetical protein NP493_405g03022 [Ridgeia piscesae]
MLQYFAQYGEVVDCVVMKNQQTGKSRGFGFVTFKDPTCVDLVLSSGPHILDGRQIDPKACNPRSMNKGGKNAENGKKKVFVGGLPTNCTESLLKDVFSRYGNVADVVIMYDQQKHRSRGFGFLTFESEEDVERVCSDHFVQINGKQVECKKAEPRDFKMIDNMATNSMLLLHSQQATLGIPTSPSMPGAIGASATFPPGVTWTQPAHVAMGGYSLVPAMNSINYGGGWGATMLPPGADLGSPTSQLQYASATPLSFSGLQGPTYAPAHALQNLEAYALHGQPQAYTSGSLPTPTALGTGDTTLSNKSVYATGMSSITHQFEFLGSYPREASSFGPARGCNVDSGLPLHNNSAHISFTPTVTYSLTPGMTAVPGGGCHNTGYAVSPTGTDCQLWRAG